jgi:outer membrane protein OmpA-like peptidoglycan-associated protein/plastocyanin
MRIRQLSVLVTLIALLLVCIQPAVAKSNRGFLIVHVTPPETYIYSEGEPVVESERHYIILPAGEHEIEMYNYGYRPEIRKVTIRARKWWNIRVEMTPIPGRISGPWGCITLENANRSAVLLNGRDPAVFFVGHVDEFNNEWGWHQELIVPPGKHQLTLEYLDADPWTTTVDVQANQRVVVDAYKGVRKTVPWPRGEQLTELPRFHAGLASAQVAVEKVKAEFAASTGQVNCGDSAHLTWSSTGAGEVEVNGAAVSPSGDQTVQPKQNTKYKFTARGPGGVFTSDAAVNVNNVIPASLSVSPAELPLNNGRQQDTATVTWSAPNADSVSVDPLGSVGASGSREVQVTPPDNTEGKTLTYTLHATSSCGGGETRTATLRVPGSVLQGAANESTLQTKLNFNSVYFPTDWPTVKDPLNGLVPSQQSRVDENATDFKQYLGLRQDAKLILEAHADERGTVAYNRALSERRAENVKSFLVEHGIPAERIEIRAFGKTKNLTSKQVEDLTVENPNATPEERRRVKRNIVVFQWANNRRVDIRLSTTGEVSQRFYPFNSADVNVLLGTREPGAKQAASLR